METTKGQELLQTLITKAWEDETFKQELIASPEQVIEKITGKTYQKNSTKKVFVVDQSNPDHIYINIPAKPNFDDKELNEGQLEAIAGGSDPMSSVRDILGDTITDWLVDVFY